MNASAAAILTDPQPSGHIVYPYTDESHVAEAVCLFAGAGLRKDEAVLLVVTRAHRKAILNLLKADGFDVPALMDSGQLVCAEAGDLLSSFMFDGIIDELLFKSKISAMIQAAKATGGSRRKVRVFGEMVDLIWQSRRRATERLEDLWNEVIEEHAVPLLCAYCLSGSVPDAFPESLLGRHSHALA